MHEESFLRSDLVQHCVASLFITLAGYAALSQQAALARVAGAVGCAAAAGAVKEAADASNLWPWCPYVSCAADTLDLIADAVGIWLACALLLIWRLFSARRGRTYLAIAPVAAAEEPDGAI